MESKKSSCRNLMEKSHAESSCQASVGFKLRKAFDARTKLDQDKLRKLKEKRQKEEERKKNAAEIAAIKRKREEMDRKDREEKRKRLEEAQRQQKELEEQLLAKKKAKEQRRRALHILKRDEYERNTKAMEEEAKKQRRIEKEKEAAERRRRMEDAKSNKFASKNAKHMEEVHQHNEVKKGIKGKDSETAEAAKRFEEKREQERKIRKELPRHGEHEKKFLEKSKELYKGKGRGEESSIACSERKRDVKVKALEPVETAKRLEEKREHEHKIRRELGRRSEHEKIFLEKSKKELYKREKEGKRDIKGKALEAAEALEKKSEQEHKFRKELARHGKRDMKALEAAEAAKRFEEKREPEHKIRKELARHGEHEKKSLEKSKRELHKGVKEGNGYIKVKALEAANRLEENREQECSIRKELVRRGKHEKKFPGKSKELHKGEKGGSNISISSGMARKKPVGCTLPKCQAESYSHVGTSTTGVDFKLRRPFESKTKLEQDQWRKLNEKRQKEEEWKKNAAEIGAIKRKKEETERKDREEKRKRLEEAQKQQKEFEEKLRAKKEAKEQRRQAQDEYERKRKAMEGEAKKQRHIEKNKEAAERRRWMKEDAKSNKFALKDAKSNKFASKDAKHMEEDHQHNEMTLQAQKTYTGKVSSMPTSCAKGRHETEGKSMLGVNANSYQSSESDINIEAYEISPYEEEGSDEEEDDDDVALRKLIPRKLIPPWARKENLIPHITSQQHVDPDEIFTGARTCNLNEVFESNDSNRTRDFNRRSYSGEWLNDCFTWEEEFLYKLQMGYIN